MVRIPIPIAFLPELAILAAMFLVPFSILWFLGNEFGRYDNYPRVFRLLVPTGNKVVLVILLYLVLFLCFPSAFSYFTGEKTDPAVTMSTAPVTVSIGKAGNTIVITPDKGNWESVASLNISLRSSSGGTTYTERSNPKKGDPIVVAGTFERDRVLCTVTYHAGLKRVILDFEL